MIYLNEDKHSCFCTFTNQYHKTKKLSNKKNLILLSGGIDSQALALYLKKRNINYETLFADYKFNKEDKQFARKIGINHIKKLDLDYLFFDKKIHLEFYKKYNCTSPQIAVHLFIIDYALTQFPEYNILMPSMPIYRLQTKNYMPDYNELGYQRYKNIKKINNFYPYFFINFDIATKLSQLQSHNNNWCNPYTKKFLLYHELGLQVYQQSACLTGFENYKIYLKQEKKLVFDQVLRRPINHQKKVKYLINTL
jgi:hypothetical protein